MNYAKHLLLGVLLCCFSAKMYSQSIAVDITKTPQDLVNTLAGSSSCVTITNPSATQGFNSYGQFTKGASNFPFTEGIILNTGNAQNAVGPYTNNDTEDESNAWRGDADLNQALGINSLNATVLEFDFVSKTNSVNFNYLFASNQYQSFYPCDYSDGFAFLIKEKNGAAPYKNIAVIPGTTTPVSSTTVHPQINATNADGSPATCAAANESYFGGFNALDSGAINYTAQTKVLNANTTVIPGVVYHIKLVIADDKFEYLDSAVFIEAGSFTSKIDFGQDRTIAANNPVCFGETITLDTKLDATYSYKWYKDGTEIPGAINSTYAVTSGGIYTVEATLGVTGCSSFGKITVEFAPQVTVANTTLVQCDDNGDGTTIFNLAKADNLVKNNNPDLTNAGYYVTLANATAKTNPITNLQNYSSSNTIIFARVENKYGCYQTAQVTLQISNASISDKTVETCDGDTTQDGFYQFDLPAQVTPQIIAGQPAGLTVNYFLNTDDALKELNALPTIFKNTANPQIIYARAVNGGNCYDITPITLVVNTFNPPNFEDESAILCKADDITLSVTNTFASYSWSNGSTINSALITSPGTYTVKVTDNKGCEKTKKFTVILSEPATLTKAQIKDFSGNDNSVLLEYSGSGDYEFSLDGTTFQNEPLFTNVPSGVYTAIARDKNGCGVSNSLTFYVLDYPRFFTPNGDGINDLWEIKNANQLPDFKITIFDRYGKLLKQLNKNGSGWTGLYNNQQLPADDYWFVLLFNDGKNVKGHFSLKR